MVEKCTKFLYLGRSFRRDQASVHNFVAYNYIPK